MAIKNKGALKTKEKETPTLPAKLADILLKGFTLQAMKSKYEDAFKGIKGEIFTYLEHDDTAPEVDVKEGFSFTIDAGTAIYTQRAKYEVDKDRIIELAEAGKITIATLVNMASFRVGDLEKVLGKKEYDACVKIDGVSEGLTFKATPDFKKSIDESFEIGSSSTVSESPAPAKPAKPIEDRDAKSSIARLKAAASSASKKPKLKVAVDDDLASILGEE